MNEPLTERQQKILTFIKHSIQEQGYPPTIREIGEAFGIRSTNGVNDHLKALERKGYLLRGELKSRALSVIEGGMPGPQPRPSGRFPALTGARKPSLSALPDGGDVVEVPVVGRVAAGAPGPAPGGHNHRRRPPRLQPSSVRRDEFRETQIIGVVVGVYRQVH